MTDGPSKMLPPEAPPLDDIILREDDPSRPASSGRASVAAPAAKEVDVLAKAVEVGVSDDRGSMRPRDRPSNRGTKPPAEPPKDARDARKRAKVTLRIPDDEVARPRSIAPTPVTGIPWVGSAPPAPRPDEGPVPRPDEGAERVRPSHVAAASAEDDTLPLPKTDLEARVEASLAEETALRAPGIDVEQDAGWTPFQPLVRELPPAAQSDASAGVRPFFRPRLDSVPLSEDIPIDTDDDELARDAEGSFTSSHPLPLDSDDIKTDDGERHTDPGEVPEVEAEDLVSVESIPLVQAPPPLKGGKALSSVQPAVTATSLMSGVTPSAGIAAAGPVALTASQTASQRAPTPPFGIGIAGHLSSASAPSPSGPFLSLLDDPYEEEEPLGAIEERARSPVAGTPMARRQQPAGGPFGFMPATSALAPPPMNESAANRKKTRPWWEDLFNDDFIRTMAKITDADIAREANFIEESLGCEAGATILDLACGTGRHAVELAARGYQVVGFDLSLAMLARASDEAQDRKQKINFVQGDMREMTFEETFDGIFSWNTSFGYFDEEKNTAVIAKVHRSLKKGGQFLLDVVNRDNLISQAPSLAWFEGDGCICMDEMHVDFITSRMKVKRTLMMDDGRTKEIEYSIRVYSLHELGKMLHDNGFRVAEVSGRTGTPGVFFGCESPRTLILAEKR